MRKYAIVEWKEVFFGSNDKTITMWHGEVPINGLILLSLSKEEKFSIHGLVLIDSVV